MSRYRHRLSHWGGRVAAVALVVALLGVPTAVGAPATAEEPPPTDSGRATSATTTITTASPPATVNPSAAPTTETTLAPATPAPEGATEAAYAVMNGNDSGAGSWRKALTDAGAATTPVTITFDWQTDVTLTSGPAIYNGAQPITVHGNDSAIDGSSAHGLLIAALTPSITIHDLTMRNGYRSGGGGAIDAVRDVTVRNSEFRDNQAVGAGGAISTVTGAVTVSDSLFIGNQAGTEGGAIGTHSGTVLVERSYFLFNSASSGGGVRAAGAVNIFHTMMVENWATAGAGGAVNAQGGMGIANSTLTDNGAAASGGGISNAGGSLIVLQSTIAGNDAPGGTNLSVNAGHALIITNSVVAYPRQGPNCYLTTATFSYGHNFADDTTCGLTAATDTQGVNHDPLLGPARNHGGRFGPTRYPLWDSPLVDAIPAGSCPAALPWDNRGVARPYPAGGSCDIGAIERVYPPHGFWDVAAWVDEAVRWMTSDTTLPQLMTGYPDGSFRADWDITRGQFVRMLYREAGSPPVAGIPDHGLTDVPAWLKDSVTWAVDGGVMTGYHNNTFRPDAAISRGEVTRAKYRFAGSQDVSLFLGHGFGDVPAWLDDAVTWASWHQLVTGYPDGTFRPLSPVTRGQVVRLDYRLAIHPGSWEDPGQAPWPMLFRSF